MKNFLATTFSLFLLPVFLVLSIVITTLLTIALVLMLPIVTLTVALNSAAKLASIILQKLAPSSANDKNYPPTLQTIALFILTPVLFLPLLPLTFPVIASMAAITIPFLVPVLIFCFYTKAKEIFKTALKEKEDNVIKPVKKEQKNDSYKLSHEYFRKVLEYQEQIKPPELDNLKNKKRIHEPEAPTEELDENKPSSFSIR